jgi:hypothetical protein
MTELVVQYEAKLSAAKELELRARDWVRQLSIKMQMRVHAYSLACEVKQLCVEIESCNTLTLTESERRRITVLNRDAGQMVAVLQRALENN